VQGLVQGPQGLDNAGSRVRRVARTLEGLGTLEGYNTPRRRRRGCGKDAGGFATLALALEQWCLFFAAAAAAAAVCLWAARYALPRHRRISKGLEKD